VDIAHFEIDSRIGERIAKDMRERATRPGHDFWHQFGHDDLRLRPPGGQGRAERETHTQPADQHAPVSVAQPRAGHRGQRLFGMTDMAAHQFVIVELDREKVALTDQMQRAAAGDLRRIDIFVAFAGGCRAGRLRDARLRDRRRNYSATLAGCSATTGAGLAALTRATCAASVRLWFLLAVRILGMRSPVC
jgi:hypothetical protein